MSVCVRTCPILFIHDVTEAAVTFPSPHKPDKVPRITVKTRSSEFTIAGFFFRFFLLLFPPLYTSLLLTGGRVLFVYREMQLRYQSGCLPRESIQRVRRTEELSLASVDHWCTSSWAFKSLPAWILREILGKSQQGCSLNGRRSLQRWMKDTFALVGFFFM